MHTSTAWLIMGVGLIVAEILLPTAFVLVCFGAGAIAAGIVAYLTRNPLAPFGTFIVVSLVAILLTRGFVKRLAKKPAQEFGAHGIIGKLGRVQEEIDPETGKGIIRIDGEEWKAVPADGKRIPQGTKVVVREVRGTRAVVEVSPDNNIQNTGS